LKEGDYAEFHAPLAGQEDYFELVAFLSILHICFFICSGCFMIRMPGLPEFVCFPRWHGEAPCGLLQAMLAGFLLN